MKKRNILNYKHNKKKVLSNNIECFYLPCFFLIVLLCRKGGEGYKEEEAAPKDEAKQLITLREEALARRLAAAN